MILNEPNDKNNFLIELTPEQLDVLRQQYEYSDENYYVELHYSPYWKNNKDLRDDTEKTNPGYEPIGERG